MVTLHEGQDVSLLAELETLSGDEAKQLLAEESAGMRGTSYE